VEFRTGRRNDRILLAQEKGFLRIDSDGVHLQVFNRSS
jgi:hypothetical protein